MPGYICRSLVLDTPSKSYPPHSRPKFDCPIRSRPTQRNFPSLSPTDFESSVSQTTNSRSVGERVRIFTKCPSRVVPTAASNCVSLSTSPRRASTPFHLLLRRVSFSPFSCVELYCSFLPRRVLCVYLAGRYSTAPLPPRVAHSLLRSAASGSAPPY